MSSHLADFNARNKSLTAKLLQQGYRFHKLRKAVSKFYPRHVEFVPIIVPDEGQFCNRASGNLNLMVI